MKIDIFERKAGEEMVKKETNKSKNTKAICSFRSKQEGRHIPSSKLKSRGLKALGEEVVRLFETVERERQINLFQYPVQIPEAPRAGMTAHGIGRSELKTGWPAPYSVSGWTDWP